jgi:hypothetical protein
MYFFFDAKSAELCSFDKFNQTILHQLLESIRTSCPKSKSKGLFSLVRKILREKPGETGYVTALKELLQNLDSPSFLVIDALDECQPRDADTRKDYDCNDLDVETIKQSLKTIEELHHNLRILITSRSLQPLSGLSQNPLHINLHLSDVSAHLNEDIEKFVHHRISREGSLTPDVMTDKVVQEVIRRSNVSLLQCL